MTSRGATERSSSDDGHKKADSALASGAQSPVSERHWTIAEVSATWNLSKDAVRKMFQDEPGVLVLGGSTGGGKRRYTTLRIPQSVVERVHRQYELGY